MKRCYSSKTIKTMCSYGESSFPSALSAINDGRKKGYMDFNDISKIIISSNYNLDENNLWERAGLIITDD